MAIGSGFLKQAMDSFKYNRAILGKDGPKEKEKHKTAGQKIPFINDKKMSGMLRDSIQKENEEFNRSEIKKRIIAAIITLALLIGIYFLDSIQF